MSEKELTIDFSDVQADEFTIVPKGKYEVEVVEIKLGQREPRDEDDHPAPYLNFQLKITEGEYENRRLFMVASFSEKAIGRTKALLETFGVDVQGKTPLKVDQATDVVIEPDLEGEPAIATVRIEKGQEGEMQSRIARLQGKHSVESTNGKAPAASAGPRFK